MDRRQFAAAAPFAASLAAEPRVRASIRKENRIESTFQAIQRRDVTKSNCLGGTFAGETTIKKLPKSGDLNAHVEQILSNWNMDAKSITLSGFPGSYVSEEYSETLNGKTIPFLHLHYTGAHNDSTITIDSYFLSAQEGPPVSRMTIRLTPPPGRAGKTYIYMEDSYTPLPGKPPTEHTEWLTFDENHFLTRGYKTIAAGKVIADTTKKPEYIHPNAIPSYLKRLTAPAQGAQR